jgi:hypothetical protein
MYKIHNNGGIPYKVEDLGGAVQIWRDVNTDSGAAPVFEPYMRKGYRRILPGVFPTQLAPRWRQGYSWQSGWKGNSVLLDLGGGRYMYIGPEIQEFTVARGDTIRAYYSPIGNSDLPYPFAVGEQNTYLMLEKVMVDNGALDRTIDPYALHYGFIRDRFPEESQSFAAGRRRFAMRNA